MKRLDKSQLERRKILEFMEKRRRNQRETILFFKRYDFLMNLEKHLEDAAYYPEAYQKMLEGLPVILRDLSISDEFLQFASTAKLGFLLLKDNPPIDEVIASGVVPRMVEFLGQQYTSKLQFHSVTVLYGIVCGTLEQANVVVELGAVPMFVQLLSSEDDGLKNRVAAALGRIANFSPNFRDHVIGHGALAPLLNILEKHSEPSNISAVILYNASWTLVNLCQGNPQPPFDLVKLALPTVRKLIHLEALYLWEVRENACIALSFLSNCPIDQIQVVIDLDILERLVLLLNHGPAYLADPLLETVGNMLRGSDSQIQVLIDNHVFASLHQILTGDRFGDHALRRICSMISIMTSGNRTQIQRVIDADLIPPLVHLVLDDNSENEVKREAGCALSHATQRGTNEQIEYLVNQGCIEALHDLLTCQDRRTLIRCLDGLKNILKAGQSQKINGVNPYAQMIDAIDGFPIIENLQIYPEIGDTAKKIINIHWRRA